jgi:DNA-binding response OmpR family regulator
LRPLWKGALALRALGTRTSMPALRILVAEHDAPLRTQITAQLSVAGFRTIGARDGAAALRIGRSGVDVAIVDTGVPVVDGFDVVRTLRGEGFRKPVVVLSAHSDEIERIVAYEIGADDYVARPFSLRELLARLRAIVRRSNIPHDPPPERLRYGRLEVDEPAREARVDGRCVPLKPREFSLLLELAQAPGIAFSRMSLLERVWGFDFSGDERTVDVHVRRLRLKVEEQHGLPRCVQTVHGFGYKFAPAP